MTELDELRADWTLRSQSLGDAVRLHSDALRTTILEQSLARVRRQGALRGAELAIWIAALGVIGVFLAQSFGHWRFFAPAAMLQTWTVITGAATIRQREALRAVNFALRPAEVQRVLSRLRRERARTVMWALLTGQVVWWIPAAIVVAKGLLGLDLYGVSPIITWFMAINLGLGLAFIPMALAAGRLIGPHLSDAGWAGVIVDAITGKDLAEARAMVALAEDFQ